MTASSEETLDAELIVPGPGDEISVEGIPARVKRLRSREIFALLRVLTTAMGPALTQLQLDGEDEDELQGQIMALFLMAVPAATSEFTDFVAQVVEPIDRADGVELAKKMQNPDPGVLIEVLELVAVQEKDDWRVLWGKVQAAISRIQVLYRPKTENPKKAVGRSGRGRARST